MSALTDPELQAALIAAVGADGVALGRDINPDDTHDEGLSAGAVTPRAVVRPTAAPQVAAIVAVCAEHRIPVTARGSGTGLSGAARPLVDGVVVAFDRMKRIIEIDVANHMAVVEPGVTLAELNTALAEHGLIYPVFPGEDSASLGGNVNTNAGGMRAVKYGVTRHHVIGLQIVLATGETIRTGGKIVKATSGYDLTQLVIGSEGTLGLVTEITVKLQPRLEHHQTVLAPFVSLEEVTAVVPEIVGSGVQPMILEYIDLAAMAAATEFVGLELPVPAVIRDRALAYLVIVLEGRTAARTEEDTALVATLLAKAGALEVYVLPDAAGDALIDARERAFFVAKAHNADEIIDVVVPRASIAEYLAKVAELAAASGSWIAGCGHAGDGNVHLSVFQTDPEARSKVLHDVFTAGIELGGAISGEHGIGTEKQKIFVELEDPIRLGLQQRIKAAFDPNQILNPGTLLPLIKEQS